MTIPNNRARLRALYQRFPDAYAADILRVKLTDDQAAMLESLVKNRRTAVKASHAIGKTFCASVAANWWYDCFDESICYITAPTWGQALGLTFKEIKRARRALKLPGDILDTGMVRDPDPIRAASHFIRALNSSSGEGFQGEHSAPILVIVEEAVGVPGYIFEAADGLMTMPECRMLIIANPTDEANQFGLACASSLYNTLTVSALEHPNILAELRDEKPPFPRAVRLAWLEEMIEKECEPTDTLVGDAFEFPRGSGKFFVPNSVFQGRVLGEFPSQADEQVVPRGWLHQLPVLQSTSAIEIGCDVARFGSDRTTIAVRQGPCVLALKELRQLDGDLVAATLMQMAQDAAPQAVKAFLAQKTQEAAEKGEKYDAPTADQIAKKIYEYARQIPIKIDVTGGLGVAPAVLLRNAGYKAVEINSSKTASKPNDYPNVRSELWFVLRERARTKDIDLSRLPRSTRDALIRELSTPKWKPDSKGRRVVEPKADIKSRLGASPDLADALCLAFLPEPTPNRIERPGFAFRYQYS